MVVVRGQVLWQYGDQGDEVYIAFGWSALDEGVVSRADSHEQSLVLGWNEIVARVWYGWVMVARRNLVGVLDADHGTFIEER